jgi:Ran GTPase-activating protein (RanGAP) involved in mRNA processing and transport
MGEHAGPIFAEILKSNKSIKHFYISGNNLGPEGTKCVAEALKVNETVEEIYFSVNKVCFFCGIISNA